MIVKFCLSVCTRRYVPYLFLFLIVIDEVVSDGTAARSNHQNYQAHLTLTNKFEANDM